MCSVLRRRRVHVGRRGRAAPQDAAHGGAPASRRPAHPGRRGGDRRPVTAKPARRGQAGVRRQHRSGAEAAGRRHRVARRDAGHREGPGGRRPAVPPAPQRGPARLPGGRRPLAALPHRLRGEPRYRRRAGTPHRRPGRRARARRGPGQGHDGQLRRAGPAPHRPGRPPPAGGCGLQPARQRGEVLPQPVGRRGSWPPGRRPGRDQRARPGHRYPRGGPRAHLRALLPGGGAHVAPRGRHRPRPGDVRHVVGNHRGQVRVESQVGQGSTFVLTLPAGPPLAAPAATTNPAKAG